MKPVKPFEAFIFDMDNTLLQSKIDFFKMKKVVYDFLVREKLLPSEFSWMDKTPSQIIECGRTHDGFQQVEKEVWQLVAEVEAEGMKNVVLEPYAMELLAHLKERNKVIALLTNNAYGAAAKALTDLSVLHLFDFVAGREQMEELKPSPSGIFHILAHDPTRPKEEWVMIGDSWIDGMAASQAGIPFIAYQASVSELEKKGVSPLRAIDSLKELHHWI
ncbi:HAD family hydrolase [Ammoniphilus sp. YIM 78166]|uniref:HAD family hydrolase n=1 Tax=Ammoniphilus sp. YIM 78166 TaxID=1644106 RepID=UPI00106F1ED7|nr:HAD-IA family hydrolase [Ammoniphilus sp. YIM 78166]